MKESLVQNGFCVSTQVTDGNNNYSLLVDDTNQKWAIIDAGLGKSAVYSYSDLIEYEILENGNSIVKGRVGSVIAGGLLFGGLGALAGASRSKKVKNTCSSLIVNIVVNNLEAPRICINLISLETETNSIVYQVAVSKAKEFSSVLSIIKAKAEQANGMVISDSSSQETILSASDEIEKFHSLMEKGIITEAEFEQKKKQLLGL